MANFPAITPSYGAQEASSPAIKSVQFGDGYEQRLVYGINQDPKLWQLVWRNIPKTDADTISTFLEARKGQEAFTWTPPDGPSGDLSKRWICDAWAKTMTYSGRYSISASFRQVFET